MKRETYTHFLGCTLINQGWRLLSQFPPFRYFPHFSTSSKHTLAIEYHVYIWQVSPQLSCGDTCQMWMWFKESNRYFCKIKNLGSEEINERNFSNPHPGQIIILIVTTQLIFTSITGDPSFLCRLGSLISFMSQITVIQSRRFFIGT